MSQVSAVCKALVNAKENQNEMDWNADYIYIYIYYNIYILGTDGGFPDSFVGLGGRTNKIQASSYGLPGKPTKHVARCLRPSSAHWKVGTVRRVLGCLALVEEFGVFRAIKYSLFRLGDLSESSAGQL